jgi:hypothetical protein
MAHTGVDLDVFADSIFERLEKGENEIGYGHVRDTPPS